jgi:2'-5' RNA ligase
LRSVAPMTTIVGTDTICISKTFLYSIETLAKKRIKNRTDHAMRQFAVIAYPRLNEVDRAWLEAVRRQHDPQAQLIPAHLTLIFPVTATVELVVAQAKHCAAGYQAFDILITQAKAHCTAINGWSYVFVLPTLGSEQINALHDRLYGGDLRRHVRHDIPYQPHITVARKADYAECASLASSMNDKGMNIPGRIDSIRVISIELSQILISA